MVPFLPSNDCEYGFLRIWLPANMLGLTRLKGERRGLMGVGFDPRTKACDPNFVENETWHGMMEVVVN